LAPLAPLAARRAGG